MVNVKNGSVLKSPDGTVRAGYVLMSASENEEYESWTAELRKLQSEGVQPSEFPRCPKFGPQRAAQEAAADAQAFTVTDYHQVGDEKVDFPLPEPEPEPEVDTPEPAPEPSSEDAGIPTGLEDLLSGSGN